MLKIGVIGCGKITQVRHAPEYAENPECGLAAWYDALPERAQAMAASQRSSPRTDTVSPAPSNVPVASAGEKRTVSPNTSASATSIVVENGKTCPGALSA